LVEKRLKDVMIAPIDQNDLGIASSQGPRRRDPGKAAADDDNALLLRLRWCWARWRRLMTKKGLTRRGPLQKPG
jgi:hypothetical protein